MRKGIDFQAQIKNSQNFLNKLQGIQKASKQIKDKNKLTVHRNIWVKQLNYLHRIDRDTTQDIDNMLVQLDKYMQYQYQDRGVFPQETPGCKPTMDKYQEQRQLFERNLLSHLQHIPLILKKSKQTPQQIDLHGVKAFMGDVQLLLQQTEQQLKKEQSQLANGNQQPQDQQAQDDDNGQQLLWQLKSMNAQVKGFDLGQEEVRGVADRQERLRQYLDHYRDRLSWDQISQVIQEFKHANQLLAQTLELQLQKIGLDYSLPLSFKHNLLTNPVTYQQLLHLYHIYMGRGKSLVLYFQRLSLQFPKCPRQTLDHLNNYIVAKVYKQRKISAARRNYQREKQQLFTKVQKEVSLRIQKKIKDAQKEAQKLLRKEEKIQLEKELQVLRAEYKERQQAQAQAKEAAQQIKRQQEKKKEGLRRLYLQDLGKRADQVKEIKQQQKVKISQKELERIQRQQMQRKKKVKQNQPKVQQRQSIQHKKLIKKIQEREIRNNQQQINQERINRAIQGYAFRPHVEFNQQRLNAPTEALIKRKEVQWDKADKIQLTKVTGYSVNQLMGDMRFRLNAALQEAGLSNTDYARQVLTQMSTKPN